MITLDEMLGEYFSTRDDGGVGFDSNNQFDLNHLETFLIEHNYICHFDREKLNELFEAVFPSVYAKSAETISNTIDAELLNKIQFLKESDKSQRTKILETIPILRAYGIQDFENISLAGDLHEDALNFLKSWGSIRSRLLRIKSTIARDDNLTLYDTIDSDLKKAGGAEVSLADLGTPSDFIHKSIREFYKYANDYNSRISDKTEGSKENTSDLILIYGGTKKDVFDALRTGDIEEVDVDSMAKIKNKNIKFACVSLKAGASRLGHVLTQLTSYLNTKIPVKPSKQPIRESIIGSVMSSIDTIIDRLKTIPETLKGYYDNFVNSIQGFIENTSGFLFSELNQKTETIQATQFKELESLGNDIEKELELVNEDKVKLCSADKAELRANLIKDLASFKQTLIRTNDDQKLISKIFTYANNPILKEYFPFQLSKTETLETVELKKNIISIIQDTLNNKEGSCVLREKIQPILKYRANLLALSYLELILDNILKNTTASNPKKIREQFVELSSTLSSEAVFGNNVSLPLIKFTGSKIEKLGYKESYKFKVPKNIADLKLGKIKINLLPKKGYLTVNLYLFNGMEMIDDKPTPTYVYYLMDTASGSSFSFKVEGQRVSYDLIV